MLAKASGGSLIGIEGAVSLGASMGDRLGTLRLAVRALHAQEGVRVRGASRIWSTAPIGGVARAPFLNAVVRVETNLTPSELLAACRRIEVRLGRKPTRRWADRTLDLDVLLHGRTVLRSEAIVVPHPRLAERPFLLALLYEAWPEAPNPWTGRPWAATLPALVRPTVVATLPRFGPSR